MFISVIAKSLQKQELLQCFSLLLSCQFLEHLLLSTAVK